LDVWIVVLRKDNFIAIVAQKMAQRYQWILGQAGKPEFVHEQHTQNDLQ
jgi:hypothetical protein